MELVPESTTRRVFRVAGYVAWAALTPFLVVGLARYLSVVFSRPWIGVALFVLAMFAVAGTSERLGQVSSGPDDVTVNDVLERVETRAASPKTEAEQADLPRLRREEEHVLRAIIRGELAQQSQHSSRRALTHELVFFFCGVLATVAVAMFVHPAV